MKKIVVPTDFSVNSKKAAYTAAKIAKRMKAKITFVHVYEKPVYNFPDFTFDASAEVRVLNFIHAKMDEFVRDPKLSGINVEKVVLTDIPVSEVARHPKTRDADLMVIGSNGERSGIADKLIGSNVDRIIRTANCPVVTVKDDKWNGEVKNLVFTSLFDGHASTTFQSIKNFGSAFDSKMHLLFISTPDSKFKSTALMKQEMHDFARDWGLENYTINDINAHSYEEGIFYFANQVNAEMIGLTTHIESKFAHLFRGSLAEDVANQAIRPVLSINTHKDITNSPLFESVEKNGQYIKSAIY